MSDPGTIRFFPPQIVWLGVTAWLVLTVAASHAEIIANNYELPVAVFGVAITALSMACGAGWASLLLTLVVNWVVAARRLKFRKPLLNWSAFFSFITSLGVWSILYLDS